MVYSLWKGSMTLQHRFRTEYMLHSLRAEMLANIYRQQSKRELPTIKHGIPTYPIWLSPCTLLGVCTLPSLSLHDDLRPQRYRPTRPSPPEESQGNGREMYFHELQSAVPPTATSSTAWSVQDEDEVRAVHCFMTRLAVFFFSGCFSRLNW